ncbi:hypothetical protein [Methanolobus halotolerans]|uniref:Phage portal protein n=1 Tax=Methanolobus halotolerans TaxID=2052935 RepID=A0A4E0PSL5_9EURY|nr:hypothetical protein [Methanolobus halotolerans]TGC06990.1 hypothetical protein CUN85_12350 [Methanolobus halotolerans]
MVYLNATITGSHKPITLMASAGVKRTDASTKFGGYENFDTDNRFKYYQQLSTCTPHVSTSLNKLALSLVKGMHFDGTGSKAVKEFERWSTKVNFFDQVQTLGRLLCRDGTYIAAPTGNAETFSLIPLLMQNTTILPEDFTVGEMNPKEILTPPTRSVVINESDKAKRKILKISDVVYGSYNAWDTVLKDPLKRDTYGIYGASMMEPIELSIRNLLNINHGYVSFVKKYGNGRYLIDFKLLEKLVEQEIVSIEDAQKVIDAWLDEHKYLSENEDIAAVGLDVIPVDAKGSLDVMSFKKSLETDIQIGLLQSPLSMGDTKGSTYAAGYVSEEDRMVVLEGLQHIVQNIANSAINMRLRLMNKTEDSLWIEFEELSRPQLESRDMIEWYNSGVLTKEQLLKWGGFPVEGE